MNSLFKALNDQTRRQIVELLKDKDMNAGEISDHFQISKPSISHHLDILKRADLISSEKKGQFIQYSLNTSILEDLLLYWRQQAQERGLTPASDRAFLKAFAGVATRPALYRAAGRIGSKIGGSPLGKVLPMLMQWSEHRALPAPSPRTFRQMWKDGIE